MGSTSFRVVAAVVLLVSLSCAKNDVASTTPSSSPSPTSAAASSSAPGGLAALAAAAPTCGYTPEATAGPFFVSGTKELSNDKLNYDDFAGTPIKVAGYVYGSDRNAKPLAGTKIEIWQADNAGRYHPQNQGSVGDFSSSEISLRGYVTTDNTGYYEFTSILPGEYEGRVRHIHVRATASGHPVKTSQIITYQTDDSITPANDSIARDFPACSLATFVSRSGAKTALFNFHIEGT